MHSILKSNDNGKSLVAADLKWRNDRPAGPLAWSSDGQQVLTGDPDGSVSLWDAISGARVRSFTGHTGAITAVAWINRNEGSSITNYVLDGSEDGTARIWDVSNGTLVRSLDAQAGPVAAVAWSPNTDWSVAIGYADGSIRIWLAKDVWPGDAQTASHGAQSLPSIRASKPNYGTSVEFDREQKILVGDNRTARIWSAATCQPLMTFSKQIGPTTALAWSSDEQQVLIGSSDGTIGVWHMPGGSSPEQARILAKYGGEVEDRLRVSPYAVW